MIDHKKGQKIKKELSNAKKWLILLWEETMATQRKIGTTIQMPAVGNS